MSTQPVVIRAPAPHQAILHAAVSGRVDALPDDWSEAKCASGCTALHWAAGANQVAVLRHLLREGGGGCVDLAIEKKYKAAGRTPLHYAARNGCLQAAQCLIQEFHAPPQARARHGVTPLHLALFQNQLPLAQYLLDASRRSGSAVDPLFQTNDYGCNLAHWLAICPASRAGPQGGVDLIRTAEWLHHEQQKTPQAYDLFHATQTQGHTVLHKAAWLGHVALIRYLHEHHDVWDDRPDQAGNYAVTLAEMAQHTATVQYLRTQCSRSAAHSCALLGLPEVSADPVLLRRAYHRMALRYHPDRQQRRRAWQSSGVENADDDDVDATGITFDAIYRAYHHMTVEGGTGQQCNAAHQRKLLLLPASSEDEPLHTERCLGNDISDDSGDCFKARLIVVLQEYGSKGLDVSNLKKKWRQVWRGEVFPDTGRGSLTQWIQRVAGDVVDVRRVQHCHRVFVRTTTLPPGT